MPTPKSRPLAGVRVFDLTVWMVGPWASMMLGALGADVLHIERPGVRPEDLGAGVPPRVRGTSAGYLAWNGNKRSLELDLKTPGDRETALKLVRDCDIFLVNMRTGAAGRLGLGYADVAAASPGIVYCSITGWGESGPMASRPGSDVQLQAFSGFWSVNGPDGADGEYYRHYAQLDPTAGNYALQAILLALYRRRRTGQGAHLQISMLESAAALQTLPLTSYLQTGEHPRPMGSASAMAAPDRAYLCQDHRWIAVAARCDAEWARLASIAEPSGALARDARFATNADRVRQRHELDAELVPRFLAMPSEYWIQRLEAARLPSARSLDFDVLRNHRQVLENSYMEEVPTTLWGRITTGGAPWAFTERDTTWFGPPAPGQHTSEILAEAGIEREENR